MGIIAKIKEIINLIILSSIISIFLALMFIIEVKDYTKIKEIIILTIFSSIISFFIASILVIEVQDYIKKSLTSKKIAKISFITIISSITIMIFFLRYRIPAYVISSPSLISIICLLIRRRRPYFRNDISNIIQNLLTMVDMIVIYFISINFIKVVKAFIDNNLLSVTIGFVWPAIYIIGGCYVLFNLGYLKPKHLEVSTWRLLAYAFPEAGEHQKRRLFKNYYYSVTFSSILGWFLAFVLITLTFLLSYKITDNELISQGISIIYMVGFAVIIIVGWWKKETKSRHIKILLDSIKGGGLLSLGASVIMLLSGILQSDEPTPKDRFIYTLIIMSPLLLLICEYLPDLPKKVVNRIKHIYEKIIAVRSVIVVSDAATKCILGENKGQLIRSILIAIVLTLYLIIPHMEDLFISAGITEINHFSTQVFFENFREISTKWEVPNKSNNVSTIIFTFGNHGLVLMSLLWYFFSLTAWVMNAPSRLKRIPDQINTKLDELFVEFHVLLFYSLFLPSLLIIGFLIPFLGAITIGQHLAIVLGVFTFGLFYPKFTGFLLIIAYLITTTLTIDIEKHTININNAKLEDLILLPDLGRKRVNIIMNNRPIRTYEELASIIGRKRMNDIKNLIRL